jgi:hypothetical protein
MMSAEVDDRVRALGDIAALARQHGLSAWEIAVALGEPVEPAATSSATPPEGRARAVLVRVLGFLGGTFVFAGIGVFIALQWDAMNTAARIIVTLGSGLAAFVLAALSSRDARFTRATTPLILVAAALEPTGMGVAFHELGSGGDWRWATLIIGGTLALQFGMALVAMRRTTLLFLCMWYGLVFCWTAFDLLQVDGNLTAVVLGGSILLAAVGVARTAHRDITPFWYFIGAAAFLGGLFDLVERTFLEVGFLAAAAGVMYLSVAVHSRTLLVVATLAVLAYTGWFTGQHFANSIGWPLALIVFGILMIGLSALAFRIDREYVQKA